MKNAHRIIDTAGAPDQGASIITLGTLLSTRDSVRAEVLAWLIEGQRLTSLDAVVKASTTRLAGAICALNKEHGWTFERVDRAVGCKDGRVSHVTEYSMNAGLRAAAMAAGAAEWCAEVHAARRVLRAKAAQAQADAERLNSEAMAAA